MWCVKGDGEAAFKEMGSVKISPGEG